MPAVADQESAVLNHDPILRKDPSPLRAAKEEPTPAYASLYAVPEIQPSEADTGKLPVIEAQKPEASSAPEANTEKSNATVLSAASARARRRARAQGGQLAD